MAEMKVKIKIENLDREIEAPVGQDLRTALMDNDVQVYEGFWKLANCQGHGMCGTCQVDVVEGPGMSEMSPWEKIRFHGLATVSRLAVKLPFIEWLPIPRLRTQDPKACRLACLTRCYQDAVVRTLETPSAE